MPLTEKHYEALKKIKNFEDSVQKEDWPNGWTWQQVALYTTTINKLLVEGCVRVVYKSRSQTCYVLTDKGKDLAASPKREDEVELTPSLEAVDFEGMFSDIVGYDNVKELLREVLQLEKPVHVLLCGPPSIAKTMFLWEIERLGGPNAMWLIGSATSRAGLWDLIAARRPRWLLIDELEKMTLIDQTGLLSLMERGRIVRTKVGRELDVKVTAWIIAAANRIDRLSAELRSRFAIRTLTEYNAKEFMQVVKGVLVARESLDPDLAAQVAMKLVGRTHDVRDAIRVARLSKRVGVEKAVKLLIA